MHANAEIEQELFLDSHEGEKWMTDGDGKPVMVDMDLTLLSRELRSLNNRSQGLEDYRKEELSRIDQCTQQKIDKIHDRIDFLQNFAHQKMKEENSTKKEFPGIGTLRISKSAESVNDEAYRNIPEEEKEQLHQGHPDIFRETTKMTPDKKAIKELLKKGELIPCFTLSGGKDVLKFKAE